MHPEEAFRRLFEEKTTVVTSFPFEEEQGHVIEATGTCRVVRLDEGPRVVLGEFSPPRTGECILESSVVHIVFELDGEGQGCALTDLVAEGTNVTATLPDFLTPHRRRRPRVSPSRRAPVILYVQTARHGTISLPVKTVSERGVGFHYPSFLQLEKDLICGIRLPVKQGQDMILTQASLIYKIEITEMSGGEEPEEEPEEEKDTEAKPGAEVESPLGEYKEWMSCALGICAQPPDEEKIRSYIARREAEIRKLIQKQ